MWLLFTYGPLFKIYTMIQVFCVICYDIMDYLKGIWVNVYSDHAQECLCMTVLSETWKILCVHFVTYNLWL